MSLDNQHYSPGDIVNGHRLSADGTTWQPINGYHTPAHGSTNQPAFAAGPHTMATHPSGSWFARHPVLTGIGGGVAALVLLVGFVAIAGGDQQGVDSEETAAAGTVSDAPEAVEPATDPKAAEEAPAEPVPAEAPAEPAPAGIGTPVRDGKFEFTVTGVEAGIAEVGESFLAEQAQGAYTLVSMTVTNIGAEPQTFFVDNIEGTDSQGREVAPDSMASWAATPDGSDVWMSEINPGNTISVVVAFDLAPGETLASVDVHDSFFSGGAVISLS